jgi:hypothetical protein
MSKKIIRAITRSYHLRAKRLALNHDCPTCHAKVGKSCVTRVAKEPRSPHKARIALGWEDLDKED